MMASFILFLSTVIIIICLTTIIAWLIEAGCRQVFHRPDTTTDCPIVEIKEPQDVHLG